MTDTMHIAAAEHGVVRIFAVDLPADAVAAFTRTTDDAKDGHWPLREALGATILNAEFIEVFDVGDLEGVGLAGYVEEGLGMPSAAVLPDRALLDGVTGTVLIVLSAAFGGAEQTLTPRAPLRWIATYQDDVEIPAMIPLRAESATGVMAGGRAKPSDAAMSGRIATIVLVVLALLVVAMIWIGG